MDKEWKPIPGFSRYYANKEGKIWDSKRVVEASQVLTGVPEYFYVNVYNEEVERKLERVHRLIALTFCEGRDDQNDIVDHIDGDRFNNKADNLRWTDSKGNSENRDVTVWVEEGKTLKDWVRENYPEHADSAYTYLHRKMRIEQRSFEDAVKDYEEYLEYGFKLKVVKYNGEDRYLLDLCKEFDKDYNVVMGRISRGWDAWESIHGIPPIDKYNNQININFSENGVVRYWFQTEGDLRVFLGAGQDFYNNRLKHLGSIKEMLDYDPNDAYRIEVHGVYGTREELCTHFGKTLSAVETVVQRKKITFEQALLLPRQRVKKLYLNGEGMTPKQLWERFEIDHIRAKKYRARTGKSFEEVLQHFGVDTSELKITF